MSRIWLAYLDPILDTFTATFAFVIIDSYLDPCPFDLGLYPLATTFASPSTATSPPFPEQRLDSLDLSFIAIDPYHPLHQLVAGQRLLLNLVIREQHQQLHPGSRLRPSYSLGPPTEPDLVERQSYLEFISLF